MRKDYEALRAKADEYDEDVGAARIIARARAEIAAGAPVFPMEIVDRITNGENAIRVLREWRGLTQVQLAAATDFGQGYISDLENSRRQGTPAALKKIAQALRVPLDVLV